jgi:hypothetical protein
MGGTIAQMLSGEEIGLPTQFWPMHNIYGKSEDAALQSYFCWAFFESDFI